MEVSALARLFSGALAEATAKFTHPSGEVHVRLGMQDRRLHSMNGLKVGDLWLCSTIFGSVWVLMGLSKLLASLPPHFSWKVLFATFPPTWPVQTFLLFTSSDPTMGPMEAEEIGLTSTNSCFSFKGCKK